MKSNTNITRDNVNLSNNVSSVKSTIDKLNSRIDDISDAISTIKTASVDNSFKDLDTFFDNMSENIKRLKASMENIDDVRQTKDIDRTVKYKVLERQELDKAKAISTLDSLKSQMRDRGYDTRYTEAGGLLETVQNKAQAGKYDNQAVATLKSRLQALAPEKSTQMMNALEESIKGSGLDTDLARNKLMELALENKLTDKKADSYVNRGDSITGLADLVQNENVRTLLSTKDYDELGEKGRQRYAEGAKMFSEFFEKQSRPGFLEGDASGQIAKSVAGAVANALGTITQYGADLISNPYQSATDSVQRQAQLSSDIGRGAGSALGGGIGAMGAIAAEANPILGLVLAEVGSNLGGAAGELVGNIVGNVQARGELSKLGLVNDNVGKNLISETGFKNIAQLQSMAADIRSSMDLDTSQVTSLLSNISTAKEKFGELFKMPNATQEQITEFMAKASQLGKVAGQDTSFMLDTTGRSYNTQQAEAIVGKIAASAFVQAGGNLSQETNKIFSMSQRNPVLGSLQTNLDNMNYTQKATADAFNRSLFGENIQKVLNDINTGKLTKEGLYGRLEKSGFVEAGESKEDVLRKLKMVDPQAYQEYESAKGSVDIQKEMLRHTKKISNAVTKQRYKKDIVNDRALTYAAAGL